MTRVLGSLGLAMSSVLVCMLMVGCSDDGNGTSDKTSGAKPSEPHTTGSATTEVKKETKTETTATKTETKPEAAPAPTTSGAPAVKPEPKPEEGKVEVKAQPDEPATTPAKPQATEPKADDKPASKSAMATPPRNDVSPSASALDDAAAKPAALPPADDLANALKFLIADAEKAVASEDEYKSQVEGRFVRDGNLIALLATALALHDCDSPVKAHAGAIVAAAHKLAEAKDYAAAKQGVAYVKTALESGTDGEVKWGKIATLNSLMKDEVPYVNTKLKNAVHHLKKRTAEATACASTMELIAENAKLYVADTKKPGEAAKWNELANQFRAAAGGVATAARAGNEAGATAAINKLNQSCHACHAIFNPESKSGE